MPIEKVYIKELEVDNYKSLRESKVSFKDGLNIIIGKNGAGKSNLLEFIDLYAIDGSLYNTISTFRNNQQLGKHLTTEFKTNIEFINNGVVQRLNVYAVKPVTQQLDLSSRNDYKIIASINGGAPVLLSSSLNSDSESIDSLKSIYRKLQRQLIDFQLIENPTWLISPAKFEISKQNEISFGERKSIYNFFSFLELLMQVQLSHKIGDVTGNANELKATILNFFRSHIERLDINSFLKKHTPIEEIRINPNINIYPTETFTIVDNLSIDFLVNNNWIPWSYLSDGTKRLFYLITEVIGINAGFILIEEPELGIHPHQLFNVMSFLKEQSRDKQIIISTHSPIVLDILNEHELDRIIIAKYEAGTKFYNLTEDQKSKAKRYINEVGELSYFWLHSDLEQ